MLGALPGRVAVADAAKELAETAMAVGDERTHTKLLDRDCRTCRNAIRTSDGYHLWCERQRLVVVFRAALGKGRCAQTTGGGKRCNSRVLEWSLRQEVHHGDRRSM